MIDILSGQKSAFLWNWRTFDGDAGDVAGLLALGGMSAVAVKSHDGSMWYEQGASIRGIVDELNDCRVKLVGSWSYHYFEDPAGELRRIRECIEYGRVDYHILNIEDPQVERNPETPAIADAMFGALRRDYPDFPFYFCSHAQPRYHDTQPYYQAAQYDIAMMPMCYHTAMQASPEDAVALTQGGLDGYVLNTVPANYAGALYGVPGWPILPSDVTNWGVAALAAGATGLTWWDLDVVRDAGELLDAVRAIPMPATC